MTSKEALEIIKKYDDYASIRFLTKGIVSPKTMGSPSKEDFKEAIDIIEQDLQILECFKELFEGEDLDSWIEFNFSMNISYINKIKEWLRNEV